MTKYYIGDSVFFLFCDAYGYGKYTFGWIEKGHFGRDNQDNDIVYFDIRDTQNRLHEREVHFIRNAYEFIKYPDQGRSATLGNSDKF